MHTIGTVCVVRARSTNSRWIIDSPLCVSHSWHACTHDWHPMQREGSMKNSRCWGTGIRCDLLLLRLERRGVRRRAVRLANATGAHLVLRDLADRILRRDSENVCALGPWPMIRDEDGVGTDGRDHLRPQRDRATAGL